ncbi:MAG: amidohydrolase [Anaerolineaceae bacterium]|nr:amidohydrolase [Anaerolineaceae bacterium]
MRILHNARIYTMDTATPVAEALAVEGGRIVAVGREADVLALARTDCIIQEMGGRTILPGLTDSHLHLKYYACSLQKINCETDSKAECLRRVAERAKTTPAGQWILGHGWNQNQWAAGAGTAAELDAAAPNHLVYLTSKSLHNSWVNSAALQASGIDNETPDPENGTIGRNASGKIDGILYEAAVNLVEKIIPEPTIANTQSAILNAQETLWKMGVTGVHDFDRRLCFAALQELAREDQLRLRVLKSIPYESLDAAIKLGLRSGFGSSYLRVGSLKLFTDGALGPHTAAMLAPYENEPNNLGMLFLDRDKLFEIGKKAASNGISMAVHAIGDAANHEIIEAYAALRQFEHKAQLLHLRNRIEHVQCLHPDDQHRLAELKIIASVQPLHATSDMYTADRYWGSRAAHAYVFQTLLSHNTRMIFGSDCPVESPNPFLGIHAAVTRQRPDGAPGPNGWFPEQRLTLEQTLQGYTTGPAYAAGLEFTAGKLSSGYLADRIVLKENPYTIPPQMLCTLQPTATMVNGEWVWQG